MDDEPIARRGIRQLLALEADITVVAECGDGEEALRTIQSERPDLMLLDIQMPGMDGFALLNAAEATVVPATIFLTAYDQFALQAFDSNAVDYVLKPVDRERFQRALSRARFEIRNAKRQENSPSTTRMITGLGVAPKPLDRLTVKCGDHLEFVRVADIDWLEANDNYVKVHSGPRSFLLSETLTRMVGCLPMYMMRIHRSRIVNLHRVKKIDPLFQGDYQFTLANQSVVSSGRHYRSALQALFRNFK